MSRSLVRILSRLAVAAGLAVALAVVVGLVGPTAGPALADKVKDDEALNYFLKLPDRWVFGKEADFAKQGVVVLADCPLELLADGKTAGTGQGARVMLSVQDVPKDFEPEYETWLYEWQLLDSRAAGMEEVSEELATLIAAAREKVEKPLAVLAGRPDVQSILLGRWEKDVKKQPRMEPDARGVEIGNIPAAKMDYKAPCANLLGNDGPCEGRLFVWIIRKKLYRMAFWIWPTEYDRERVKDDVDNVELSYETPKTTALPRKLPDPGKAVDPLAPKGDPDVEQEKVLRDPAFQFEILKPARFKSIKIERARADQKRLGARLDAISGPSSVIVELLVYAVKNAAEPFSVEQYLTDFWATYQRTHPKGKIETAPFLPVGMKQPFLSLPDMTKKKEVARPPKDKDGKDEKQSISDLERLGVITESKQITIAKEKVKSTWRVCMMGNAERAGDEVSIQYVFQTSDFCYVLRMVCRRDGFTPFKDALAQILASIKVFEPK